MKVEVILHFNFDEDKIDYKGQKLLDNLKVAFEEEILQERGLDCTVMSVKFIEAGENEG